MEIRRLHALHGMHFIMYHDDNPIRKRHSSLSFAHKNTKTIAQLLQKCPLTVKSVFEKMRLQMPLACVADALNLYKWFRRVRGPAATQAKMPPPLKKRGEKLSLPDLFWREGCVCLGDRCFHWIHVEDRSNRRKNIPLQTKAYTWGRGLIYARLLFALNNTNSYSSIVSFLPALSQLKLA